MDLWRVWTHLCVRGWLSVKTYFQENLFRPLACNSYLWKVTFVANWEHYNMRYNNVDCTYINTELIPAYSIDFPSAL